MRWILRLFVLLALIGAGLYAFVGYTEAGQLWALKRLASAAVSAPGSPANVDGLRVFMCGTRSPLPAPGRAEACVSVQAGDKRFLVDAGGGSAATAQAGGEDLSNLKAVLLTHYHSDHITGIPTFNLVSWVAGRKAQLELWGGPGIERIANGFNEAMLMDRGYRVAHHGMAMLPPELGKLKAREVAPGVIYDEDGLTITAFPVDHAPVVPAYGFRFDYKGRSVVVSGDSNVVDTLVEAADGADLLLHDVLSLPIIQTLEAANRESGSKRLEKILFDIQDYHAAVSAVDNASGRLNVKQLAAYHFVPAPWNWLFKRVYQRTLPEGTLMTDDGMVIELPAGSEAIIVQEP